MSDRLWMIEKIAEIDGEPIYAPHVGMDRGHEIDSYLIAEWFHAKERFFLASSAIHEAHERAERTRGGPA